MYIEHFGFQETPFALTPDPRFLYLSDRHREGLAHLLYGLQEGGGFVQLTGEIGTGKTTLCRALLDQLPEDTDAAFLLNPRVTALELLASLCDELGIEYAASTLSQKDLADRLYRHLLDAHARGRRPIAIIDEAQNLNPEVLEQLRLLTNLETTKRKLLQIILIGQPELIDVLARHDLRQLKQRVTARYHLLPFSAHETRAYIAHRTAIAGVSGTVFSRSACAVVHRRSGGVPRLINVYCDRALLGSYVHGQRQVNASTARKAAAEVEGHPARRRSKLAGLAFASGLTAAGVLAALPWLEQPLSRLKGTILNDLTNPTTPAQMAAISGSPTDDRPADDATVSTPTGSGPNNLRLREWIDALAGKADQRTAFRALLAIWGIDSAIADIKGACTLAALHALQCLTRKGGWQEVRILDLPAIVELRPSANEAPRYFTVVALRGSEATLVTDGEQHTFPEQEIDPLWSGRYTLIWRPPTLRSKLIVPGYTGEETVWLREQLERLGSKQSPAAQPEHFDEALRERVLEFQSSWGLPPDGVIGPETMLYLTAAVRTPGTPSLRPPET